MITRKIPAPAGHTGGFARSLAYITDPAKAAWMHSHGVLDLTTAAAEMAAQAARSRRCHDPVHHEVIAYAHDERPSREQMIADAERVLAARDLAGHAYVLARHNNTDDWHVHVIANRIGPDGKANDQRWDDVKAEREVARIALERGWTVVAGRHNRAVLRAYGEPIPALPPQRRLAPGDLARLQRQGELPWQDAARPYVREAIAQAESWQDLHRRLDAQGLVCKLVQRGARVQGLAFAEGFGADAPGCGAARLGEDCKLSALVARFGPFVAAPAALRTQEAGRPAPGASGLRAVDRAHPRQTPDASADRRLPATEPTGRAATGQIRRRAERDAAWSQAKVQGLQDNALLRSEYRAYREQAVQRRGAEAQARQAAAWSQEKAQRAAEAAARFRSRRLQRDLAYAAFGRGVLRRTALWSIDALAERRRRREQAAARQRWEQTKAALRAERDAQRPLDFRQFVAQRAAQGSEAAQRQLDWLQRQEARAADGLQRAGVPRAPHPVDAFQQLRRQAEAAGRETPAQRRALDLLAQRIDRDPPARRQAAAYGLAEAVQARVAALRAEREAAARTAAKREPPATRERGDRGRDRGLDR